MAERQTLHIFCDGIGGTTFSYTEDRTGVNLPKLTARKWVFHSTIEVMPGEEPRAGMDINDIQAEIRKHGVCVKENVVIMQKHPPQIVA
jgi:hypothetical protein